MARIKSKPPKRRDGRQMVVRLLPLPEEAIRQLMIGYHLTLHSLRVQRGDHSHFVTMAQVIVSSSRLFDAGFGNARIEGLAEAHDVLECSHRVSVETGVWGIDQLTFELLADLLILYEEQLCKAPLHAVIKSTKKGESSKADELRRC